MRRIRIVMTNSKNMPHASRHGFTLIEVMISIAMLMTITIIIYNGFMSAIQYSTNTKILQKTATKSDSSVAYNISHDTASSSMVSGVSTTGIYLYNSTGKSFVLPVAVYDGTATANLSYGDSKYTESGTTSSNRHGFSYEAPYCPTHPTTQLKLYLNATDGKYYWYCPVAGCTYERLAN